MDLINRFGRQINLNLKTIFSGNNIVYFLFIIISCSLIPVVYLKFEYSIGEVFSICIFLISAIISYKLINSNFKGNIYLNKRLIKNDIFFELTSHFLTLIFICFFVFLILIISCQLLVVINIYDYMASEKDESFYNVLKLPFAYMWYQCLIVVLITLSFTYTANKIKLSKLWFWNLIAIILIILLIFGGAMNNYFHRTATLSSGVVYPVFKIDGDLRSNNSLFPNLLFIPTTILFPYYSPSLMMTVSGQLIKFRSSNNGIEVWWGMWRGYSPWLWEKQSLLDLVGSSSKAWKWNILWIMPYIHIALIIFIGKMFNKRS